MIRRELRPQRGPFDLSGILQRRHEILFALTLEFFLRGTEGGNTGGDLIALTGFAFFVFGHDHPLGFTTELKHCRRIILSRIHTSIDASEWGVNGEEALQDCDMRRPEKIAECVVLALDKSVSNLAACAWLLQDKPDREAAIDRIGSSKWR
nr:hypothetical protein [Bradyrhizobium diazoefficiens]